MRPQRKDTVGDFQGVVPTRKSWGHVVLLLNNTVQLAKGRQGSRSHPHDKVLIDEAIIFQVIVKLIDGLAPIDWLGRA